MSIANYRVLWFFIGLVIGNAAPLGIIYTITYLSGASTPEEGVAKSFLFLFLFILVAAVGGGFSPILLKNWTGLALLAIGTNLPLSTFLAYGAYTGLSETYTVLFLVYAITLGILLFISGYSRIGMRIAIDEPKPNQVKD